MNSSMERERFPARGERDSLYSQYHSTKNFLREVLEEMSIYHGITLGTALTLMSHRSCVVWMLFREHGRMDSHPA